MNENRQIFVNTYPVTMKTSNAVEIMHRRYIKGNKWRLMCIKWEKIKIKFTMWLNDR